MIVCLKKLWELMVLGYARNVIIAEFCAGAISREEMLKKLDELDDK